MEPNLTFKEYVYPINLLMELSRGKGMTSFTAALSDEFLDTLQSVLDTLPDNIKTAIMGRYRDQMTFDEIGLLLNLSGARAAQLTAKGLRLLRHPSRYRVLKGDISSTVQSETEPDTPCNPEDTSVAAMGLTLQAENNLLRMNIWTAGDILKMSPQELANTRGIGVGKITLIAERLEALGLNASKYRSFLETL